MTYRLAWKYLLILLAVIFLPFQARAAGNDTEVLKAALDASLKAEGRRLGDYTLVDQDGVKFNLSEYFKDGAPLVISYIYTSCPDVCPAVTADFKKAIDAARDKFGGRFNVLSVGFDPAGDTPARMKAYGAHFTTAFKTFRFASSDAETIKRLTTEAGFFYRKNAEGGFDHIDMVSVVKPDGTIYKQVYGIRGGQANIVIRLEELLTGRPYISETASLLTRAKYFCFKYDPYTGRYAIDYPILVSVLIQSIVLITIVLAVWGRRIKKFLSRVFRPDK